MAEYVKILSGATHAQMLNSEFSKYIQLTRSETSPGEGWWPVEKVLPKPVPGEGQELAYSYTIRDGSAYKEYFLVPAGSSLSPRRWSRLSIKTALADAHMLPAARQILSAFEIKPDYPAWEALTDCDYIEEGYGGYEQWNALLDGAAQALGKTRDEIDAFLDAIPTEG